MQNPGTRISRFALENSGNGNLKEDRDKHDINKQQVNGGRSRPSSSVASSFSNQPQWPRSYQNAMNTRIFPGPDVTQIFKKIIEVVVGSYEYLLEKKRACLPPCLPWGK